MTAEKRIDKPLAFMVMLIGLSVAVGSPAHANKSVYDWALVSLDYTRKEKVQQLKRFCDRIHSLAQKASADQAVRNCFDINLRYEASLGSGTVPEALTEKVTALRDVFNGYYIENYFSFYDILFVDAKGDVFYSIRKEYDFNSNLFEGDMAHSALSRGLKNARSREVFVDFHDYGPSSEPAAFFIEPMEYDGRHIGWIVFQCAINKVNTIFAGTEELGTTGETFLVDQKGLMLTESNFLGNSTILTQRLDDRNIQAKFADKHGHRTVTDYRGHRALTSFEVVEFLGTQWLVVAKVDVDEILTRHYAQHERYYSDKLLSHLKKRPSPPTRAARPTTVPSRTLRIDMDEFAVASAGERLFTFGLSTCTGLLAAKPGTFAYLAHVSPIDKVYGADSTNLLGQMLNKIKSFNIYPCEKRFMRFTVVATHLNSLPLTLGKLVQEGFLLSQVDILFNPAADTAAISYDCADNHLIVDWHKNDSPSRSVSHTQEDAVNAGDMFQSIMDSDETGQT